MLTGDETESKENLTRQKKRLGDNKREVSVSIKEGFHARKLIFLDILLSWTTKN